MRDEEDDLDVEARAVSVNVSRVGQNEDANIDSGCGKLMTPHLHQLEGPVPKRVNVRLADDLLIKSTHVGTMSLLIYGSPSQRMLLVPNLQEPLLSVSQLCDDGNTVCFDSNGCYIFNNPTLNILSLGKPAGVGERRGNLFYLPRAVGALSASTTLSSRSNDDSLLMWHNRLGHVGLKPLKTFLKSCNIFPSLFNKVHVQQYPTCVQSKLHCLKFSSRSTHRSKLKGKLIHSDVCSFEEHSCEGFRY